jgi:hypothetical protein
MRHVAMEGRCFVLTTCQLLRRSNLPADIPNQISDEPDAILLGGGAAIVGPLGAVLAGPCFDEERTCMPNSTSTRSRGGSTTSMLLATTHAQMCSS